MGKMTCLQQLCILLSQLVGSSSSIAFFSCCQNFPNTCCSMSQPIMCTRKDFLFETFCATFFTGYYIALKENAHESVCFLASFFLSRHVVFMFLIFFFFFLQDFLKRYSRSFESHVKASPPYNLAATQIDSSSKTPGKSRACAGSTNGFPNCPSPLLQHLLTRLS